MLNACPLLLGDALIALYPADDATGQPVTAAPVWLGGIANQLTLRKKPITSRGWYSGDENPSYNIAGREHEITMEQLWVVPLATGADFDLNEDGLFVLDVVWRDQQSPLWIRRRYFGLHLNTEEVRSNDVKEFGGARSFIAQRFEKASGRILSDALPAGIPLSPGVEPGQFLLVATDATELRTMPVPDANAVTALTLQGFAANDLCGHGWSYDPASTLPDDGSDLSPFVQPASVSGAGRWIYSGSSAFLGVPILGGAWWQPNSYRLVLTSPTGAARCELFVNAAGPPDDLGVTEVTGTTPLVTVAAFDHTNHRFILAAGQTVCLRTADDSGRVELGCAETGELTAARVSNGLTLPGAIGFDSGARRFCLPVGVTLALRAYGCVQTITATAAGELQINSRQIINII